VTLWRSFALLVLLVSLGCAPGRFADFKDSTRLSMGVGVGLSVDAKLAALTHPSLGFVASSAQWGLESRELEGPWYEARVSVPFSIYWYRREGQPWSWALGSTGWRGVWESLDWLDAIDELDEPIDQQPLPETGTRPIDELLAERVSVSHWLPMRLPDEKGASLWSFGNATDVHVGAHALLVNLRVGLNLLELCDFLLGFGGVDIAGDDPKKE
jgi:hypothetical protein